MPVAEYQNLNAPDLSHFLAPNIDGATRNSVLDYLINRGFYDSRTDTLNTVEVEDNTGVGVIAPGPDTVLLDLTNASNVVDTDSGSNLQVIAMDYATGGSLTVMGGYDVLVAGGVGNDTITLQDFGNDVVLGGTGNDYIVGGFGSDSLYGGVGDDTVTAGQGDYQLVDGGVGNDTLAGGDGSYDTVQGGAGDDSIQTGAGDNQLVVGGAGNDTIYAGTGSGDTLQGGTGNDVVYYDAFADGSASIDGGVGNDTLYLNVNSTDVTMNTNAQGTITIKFTEAGTGQVIKVSNIEHIIFNDTV